MKFLTLSCCKLLPSPRLHVKTPFSCNLTLLTNLSLLILTLLLRKNWSFIFTLNPSIQYNLIKFSLAELSFSLNYSGLDITLMNLLCDLTSAVISILSKKLIAGIALRVWWHLWRACTDNILVQDHSSH